MFYVKVYKQPDNCRILEFEKRDDAIRKFNSLCDHYNNFDEQYDHIDICEDNTVLFDTWRI